MRQCVPESHNAETVRVKVDLCVPVELMHTVRKNARVSMKAHLRPRPTPVRILIGQKRSRNQSRVLILLTLKLRQNSQFSTPNTGCVAVLVAGSVP